MKTVWWGLRRCKAAQWSWKRFDVQSRLVEVLRASQSFALRTSKISSADWVHSSIESDPSNNTHVILQRSPFQTNFHLNRITSKSNQKSCKSQNSKTRGTPKTTTKPCVSNGISRRFFSPYAHHTKNIFSRFSVLFCVPLNLKVREPFYIKCLIRSTQTNLRGKKKKKRTNRSSVRKSVNTIAEKFALRTLI